MQNFSRYCPNPSSVYITPCKHRKMFSIPFYKITFPRKRRKTLCLWQMKGKSLVVIYILVQKILPVLVWQKRGFYFHLKCRLMLKTSIQHVCTDFSSLKPQSYGWIEYLVEFLAQNFVQNCGFLISACTEKHVDATISFT